MTTVKVGIIGGSGLDNPDILENREEKHVTTQFGKPSDSLVLGNISGIKCVLLPRHGRQHTIMPSNINYRANIEALKAEGCTHLVVTTACGSLHEDMHPGDIVLIDQFIDRTQKRAQTFYDGSSSSLPGVCHIPMNEPFCSRTRQILSGCLKDLGYRYHTTGTMVTIEGPRFSSKAESKMFRLWGGEVINMSTVPEVVLAKEAGLCYASLALVTDYDSWREDTEAVNVELAVKVFKENAVKAINVLKKAIPRIAAEDWKETIAEHKDIAKRSVMLPPEK
ncbi:S-methyl-5'-thioadenosine phosphorylase-like isoform X1 [Haliotis rufescens]|uniref:S-methyl-5'-thioadenosine phosphorylase-like isoform X1 n=1 Tax=Haliotis rufescens TaxID=6454 RepID=UPI00201F5E77|nr:S-methyl-5'-thioadenosine phosphorylase-like isoform X1 [Haliotis rufescens]